jgi:hypothetical protein
MKTITANRLTDGRVVYLHADNQGWTARSRPGRPSEDDEVEAALDLAMRDILLVVGPYPSRSTRRRTAFRPPAASMCAKPSACPAPAPARPKLASSAEAPHVSL